MGADYLPSLLDISESEGCQMRSCTGWQSK